MTTVLTPPDALPLDATPRALAHEERREQVMPGAGGTLAAFAVTTGGGYDGAFRVASVLRSRGYLVRRLDIDVSGDGRTAEVHGHLLAPAGQHAVLAARLERLPKVVDVRVTVSTTVGAPRG